MRANTKLVLLCSILALCWGVTGFGAVIYVDVSNVSGTEDGTSWATAWTNMAQGMTDLAAKNGVSQGGHTVMVRGTYEERVSVNINHAGLPLSVNTIKTEDGAVIDEPATQYGFSLPNGAANCVIEGFTLESDVNAAIRVNIVTNVTVRKCVFYGSSARFRGVYASSSPNGLLVENCTFWNCNGVYTYTGHNNIVIRNCIFAACSAGIHERSSGTIAVSNNVFYGNGLHCYLRDPTTYCFTEDEINTHPSCGSNIVANPGFYMPSGYAFDQFYTNTVCATASDSGGFVGACGAGDVVFFPVAERTFYVDDSLGDDSRTVEEAQNAATPWKTISKAATAAIAGDTVIVKPGRYSDEGASVTINKGGTYDADSDTVLPVTYRADPRGSVTVEADPAAFRIERAGGVVLDGFVVDRAGTAVDYGVYLSASAGCEIDNFVITNLYHSGGAGVYISSGQHTVSGTELGFNNGYGLFMYSGGCVLNEASIHDNRYGISKNGMSYLKTYRTKLYENTNYGCGVYNSVYYNGGNYTLLENCAVYGNKTGVQVSDSGNYGNTVTILFQCTVYGNGLYGVDLSTAYSKAQPMNTIIANNPCGVREFDANAKAYARYSCFWNNTTNYFKSGTTPLNTALEINDGSQCYSNIVVDPVFLNAAGGDFRVPATSPCVDEGNDLSGYGVTNDFFNNPRPRLQAYDIGFYEAPPQGVIITVW